MVKANRPRAAAHRRSGGRSRATQSMPSGVSAVPTSMPLASPGERRGLAVPAPNGCPKPLQQRFGLFGMLPLQRPTLDDPLQRLRHVEPRSRQRGGEQADAPLATPLNHRRRPMARQAIPDQQHPQRRILLIVVRRLRVVVPIDPPPPDRRRARSRRALRQDRRQLLLQPRMQHRVGRVLDRLGPHVAGGWPQERQQLHRAAADVLVGSAGGLAFGLPGLARLGNRLVGTTFVLGPDRQSESFPYFVCLLDEPLFWSASGSTTVTTPSLRLRTATPVSHQVRLSCQVKPASCSTCTTVNPLTSGSPSGAWRSARLSNSTDQVAVPSLSRSGGRRNSRTIRSRSPGPYLRRRPARGWSSSAARPWRLKRRTRAATESPTCHPTCQAAWVRVAPSATARSATARRWRRSDSLGALTTRVSSCCSASLSGRSGSRIGRAMVSPPHQAVRQVYHIGKSSGK